MAARLRCSHPERCAAGIIPVLRPCSACPALLLAQQYGDADTPFLYRLLFLARRAALDWRRRGLLVAARRRQRDAPAAGGPGSVHRYAGYAGSLLDRVYPTAPLL